MDDLVLIIKSYKKNIYIDNRKKQENVRKHERPGYSNLLL